MSLVRCRHCNNGNVLSNAYFEVFRVPKDGTIDVVDIRINLNGSGSHRTYLRVTSNKVLCKALPVTGGLSERVCVNCLSPLAVKDVYYIVSTDGEESVHFNSDAGSDVDFLVFEKYFKVPHTKYYSNKLQQVTRLADLYFNENNLKQFTLKSRHVNYKDLYKRLWSLNVSALSTVDLLKLNRFIQLK